MQYEAHDGTLVQANSLDYMRGLPDSSVALIVADPPYGIGYHSNRYKDKNPHAPIARDWNFQVLPFLGECARVLREGAAAYVFCRWDISVLWASQIPPALKLKTIVIWVKNSHSSGDLTGCFGNRYEQVLFLTKGRHRLRGPRHSNVWEFDRVSHKHLLHPAQKPTPLLRRIVESSSDTGDLVLDPFAGSGSTGEACREAGRRFCLVDVDETMISLMGRRLAIPVAAGERPAFEDVPSAQSFALDSDGYGVHPEELAAVAWQIRANRAGLADNGPLFASDE